MLQKCYFEQANKFTSGRLEQNANTGFKWL